MAHKVIVPPKNNYILQFLKQRVINSYYSPLPPTPSVSGLKLVCNINIVYGNLKSENSQDNAQKPQQNCTFMNSAS